MRGLRSLGRMREGLSFRSQLEHALGRESEPVFAGRRLRAPDRVAAWEIAFQIAGGEYRYPGLIPRQGERVVDIGANIGVYSLWAVRKGATVVAYEPSPQTFEYLRQNVDGLEVTPIHAAVVGGSEEGGFVSLFSAGGRSTRNTLLAKEIESGEPLDTSTRVPSIGIDAVLTRGCDLLKVDCEGSEFEIFLGASDLALQRAKRIVAEFHRIAGDPGLLLARLREAGFSADVLKGACRREPFGLIGAFSPEALGR